MGDEFVDVNEGEKAIMTLWNEFVLKGNYTGDCQIPFACKRFVELYGKEITEKNLYRNFCLHLTNLFDFGLLTAEDVHSTVQLLQLQMSAPTEAVVGIGKSPNSKPSVAAISGHTEKEPTINAEQDLSNLSKGQMLYVNEEVKDSP